VILLLFLYGALLAPAHHYHYVVVLSTSAVFVALWLTNVELNITALIGHDDDHRHIDPKNGDLLRLGIYRAAPHDGRPREALREAARKPPAADHHDDALPPSSR